MDEIKGRCDVFVKWIDEIEYSKRLNKKLLNYFFISTVIPIDSC